MLELNKKKFFGRRDGRSNFELRNINIKLNIIPSAISSFYIEFGVNKILLTLFGPIIDIKKRNNSSGFVKTILLDSFEKTVNSINCEKDVSVINSLIERLVLMRLFQGSTFIILVRKLKCGYNFNGFLTWASQILFTLSDLPCRIKLAYNNLGIMGENILIDPTLDELFFTKNYLEIISGDDFDSTLLNLYSSNLKNFIDLEKYIGFMGNHFFKIIFLKICPNKYYFSIIG